MEKVFHNSDYLFKINKLNLIKNRLLIKKTPIKYSSKRHLDKSMNISSKINNFETVDTSSRINNTNIAIGEKFKIIPYKKKNLKFNSKSDKKAIKEGHYSELSIGKIECQIPKNYESIKSFENPKESQTFFSQKEFIHDKNSLNYNNITFKEIKCDEIKSPKSLDINDEYKMSGNSVRNFKNKELIRRFKTSIFDSLKTNIFKMEKNIFNKRIKKIRNREIHLNEKSKEINKTAEKIDNKNKFNFIKSKIGINNNLNNNKELNSKSMIKYEFNKKKIPKINTKLKIKNLKSLKIKINSQKANNKKYIKKICKIQSIWKGIHYRKLFFFKVNLDQFLKIINSIINKNYKRNFINILKYRNELEENKIYNDYLNHFNLNLNIMNNAQVIIKQCQSFKEKEIMKNYKISKNNLSLINNKIILKEICHNESINIIKNKTIESKLDTILKEESQNNLTTEIKGIKQKKLFSNCLIEGQKNNNINIIKNHTNINDNNNKKILQNNSLNLNIVRNADLTFTKKDKEIINLKKSNINNFQILIKNKKNSEKTSNTLNEITYNNIKNKNYIKDYNINNEIDNKSALEINPFEIKRENKLEYLNNNNKKAKINLKKIILPIKIKSIFLEINKRYIFYILINNLKNKTLIEHLININNSNINKYKKYFFQKMKKINSLYYKDLFLRQTSNIKLSKLFNEYFYFIRNKVLIEAIKLLVSINIK